MIILVNEMFHNKLCYCFGPVNDDYVFFNQSCFETNVGYY